MPAASYFVQGRTALRYAVLRGYTPIVELLLCKGADVNAKSHKVSEHAPN